jgi:hypothetical protein
MARVAVESEAYQLEEVSQNEDTFDTLGASRYSFFSPAILQKFLSISLLVFHLFPSFFADIFLHFQTQQ